MLATVALALKFLSLLLPRRSASALWAAPYDGLFSSAVPAVPGASRPDDVDHPGRQGRPGRIRSDALTRSGPAGPQTTNAQIRGWTGGGCRRHLMPRIDWTNLICYSTRRSSSRHPGRVEHIFRDGGIFRRINFLKVGLRMRWGLLSSFRRWIVIYGFPQTR